MFELNFDNRVTQEKSKFTDKSLINDRNNKILSLRKSQLDSYILSSRKKKPIILPYFSSPSLSLNDSMSALKATKNPNEIKMYLQSIREYFQYTSQPEEKKTASNFLEQQFLKICLQIFNYESVTDDIANEIFWILLNIFSIHDLPNEYNEQIISNEYIQIFKNYLFKNDAEISSNILWLISNVLKGKDGLIIRFILEFSDFCYKILNIVSNDHMINIEILNQYSKLLSTLSNLTTDNYDVQPEIIEFMEVILEKLTFLFISQISREVKMHSLIGIYYIMHIENTEVNFFQYLKTKINYDILLYIIKSEYLSSTESYLDLESTIIDNKLILYSIKFLNFCLDELLSEEIMSYINNGLIEYVEKIFMIINTYDKDPKMKTKSDIKEEAMNLLLSISRVNEECAEKIVSSKIITSYIINSQLFPPLIKLVNTILQYDAIFLAEKLYSNKIIDKIMNNIQTYNSVSIRYEDMMNCIIIIHCFLLSYENVEEKPIYYLEILNNFKESLSRFSSINENKILFFLEYKYKY